MRVTCRSGRVAGRPKHPSVCVPGVKHWLRACCQTAGVYVRAAAKSRSASSTRTSSSRNDRPARMVAGPAGATRCWARSRCKMSSLDDRPAPTMLVNGLRWNGAGEQWGRFRPRRWSLRLRQARRSAPRGGALYRRACRWTRSAASTAATGPISRTSTRGSAVAGWRLAWRLRAGGRPRRGGGARRASDPGRDASTSSRVCAPGRPSPARSRRARPCAAGRRAG